jgi:hypothetical protein
MLNIDSENERIKHVNILKNLDKKSYAENKILTENMETERKKYVVKKLQIVRTKEIRKKRNDIKKRFNDFMNESQLVEKLINYKNN